MHSVDSRTLPQVTASDLPKSFAEEMLELPSFWRSDIEKLFDMLPKELPP